MEHRIVDLHVHSTASDGTLSPREVVLAAKEAKLAAIALTDHDTVSGIPEARAAADDCGFELVPGIELSTEYELPRGKDQKKEVHIVGLYIDPHNAHLLAKIKEFQNHRNLRNEEMIRALQKEGFSITMADVIAENPDSVITRANIARFLYAHGCIKSVQEAFEKYIGDGCRCHVGRFKVTPMDAVSLIRESGGIAVLAHPLLYRLSSSNLQALVEDLKEAGLGGIEALYSTHTVGEEQLVKKIAAENNLLISGGSDFHGSTKPAIRLGVGRGHLYIPYQVLEHLKSASGR